jgi:hypothetical protein
MREYCRARAFCVRSEEGRWAQFWIHFGYTLDTLFSEFRLHQG